MSRGAIIFLLAVTLTPMTAQTEEADKPNAAILEAVERQKAENALATARYGDPLQPKSGAIDGSEKLIPLVTPRLPVLSGNLAIGLASAINGTESCGGVKVVVDQDIPVARLTSAMSNYETLSNLESAIRAVENPGPGLASLPVAFSMIGGAASVLKLFQSDYKVGGANIDVDMDWFVAALVEGNSSMITERFPQLADIQLVVDDLAEVQKRATATKNADIIKAVNAYIGSVTAGGSSAPVVAMAQYRSLRGRQDYCLVFLKAGISALSMTRTSAFGGGGKAYLRADMVATALLVQADGKPKERICLTGSISGTVDMKKLTSDGTLPILTPSPPISCS